MPFETIHAFIPFKLQSHTIEVEIKSISNLDGNLRIGLYNSSVEFPEEHATFMNKVIAVSSSSITFSFTEVPEGTYCVSLYQDLNYNNKLDYNFVGLPLEAYGFSNNIIPMFRAGCMGLHLCYAAT